MGRGGKGLFENDIFIKKHIKEERYDKTTIKIS